MMCIAVEYLLCHMRATKAQLCICAQFDLQYLFEVVFVKCVCTWRTSVFFHFLGVLSGVIYNYSPPLFFIIQSHSFAAKNCAIGNIVK